MDEADPLQKAKVREEERDHWSQHRNGTNFIFGIWKAYLYGKEAQMRFAHFDSSWATW